MAIHGGRRSIIPFLIGLSGALAISWVLYLGIKWGLLLLGLPDINGTIMAIGGTVLVFVVWGMIGFSED